jgi:hypothetical protein
LKNSSIVACVFIAAGTVLPSRCLATIHMQTQTMNYAVEIHSVVMMELPNLIKIDSVVLKLIKGIHRHRKHDNLIR